jgi:DNA polymerase III sliding clamp (beta) subunit (PCNA family)
VKVQSALVKESGEFVIDFNRFRDRVSKAGPQIVLDSDDQSLKIISSEDQRLGLKLNDPREFPTVAWNVTDESYGLKTEEFIGLLSTANTLASGVSSLTPAFLQLKIRDQELWAASGSTYHRFKLHCNPTLNTSIPLNTVPALISFIKESEGGTIWMSQDEGDEVVISVGHDQLQTSPLAVQFPDLNGLFDRVQVTSTHELHLQRREIINALSKAASSADAYNRVSLSFEGEVATSMLVRTESEVGDWFEIKIPCLWSGKKDRTMVFNSEDLIRFIRSFESEEIKLLVGDDYKREVAAIYCEERDHSGILNQFRI